MNRTFRLRKKIKYQGMVYSACFLTALIASTSIFFLENPVKHGFKDEHSVAVAGGISAVLLGGMTLMSLYLWAAYYVERFTINGTALSIRSLLQNRQFDISELESLEWRIHPACGSIKFFAFGSKSRLDLYGYDKEDRLSIIQALQKLVPAQVQEGWPIFCYKVALPLRDVKTPECQLAQSIDFVVITRRRYDRLFVFLLPLSALVAVVLGWLLGLWQFAIWPLFMAGAWLLLRFNVPSEGRIVTKMLSTQEGRGQIIGICAIVVAQLVMVGLTLVGVEKSTACTAAYIIMVAAFPPMLYFLNKAEKKRKKDDEDGASTAPQIWISAE